MHTSEVFDVVETGHGEEDGLCRVCQVSNGHMVVGAVEQVLDGFGEKTYEFAASRCAFEGGGC